MKNFKSPPMETLSTITHRFKAYRIDCNHSKRRIVQERLLGVEEKLYKMFLSSWCKKSCTDLIKIICQVVYKVLVLGVQNQGKEKSQAGCLGTGCKSQGPNQDKISCVYVCIIS